MATDEGDHSHVFNQTNESTLVNPSRLIAITFEHGDRPTFKLYGTRTYGHDAILTSEITKISEHENETENIINVDVCLMKIQRGPIFLIPVKQFLKPFWYFTTTKNLTSRSLSIKLHQKRISLDKSLLTHSNGNKITEYNRTPDSHATSNIAVYIPLSLFLDSGENYFKYTDLDLEAFTGCLFNLVRNSGCSADLPQRSHDPSSQSFLCPELKTTVTVNYESFIDYCPEEANSSKRKRFSKFISGADSIKREQRNRMVSSKRKNFETNLWQGTQISKEVEKLSKQKALSVINCKYLPQTWVSVGCHRNMKFGVSFKKNGLRETSYRKQIQNNFEEYVALSINNVYITDRRFQNYTYYIHNIPDVMSNENRSYRGGINSRMVMRHSSKINESYKDSIANRNNSSNISTNSSSTNSNNEKENSDSSSSYVNSSNEKEISDNSSSCVNSNNEKEISDNSSSCVNSTNEKENSDSSSSCVNSNNEKEISDNSSSCVNSNNEKENSDSSSSNEKEISDNSSSCVNSNKEKENSDSGSSYVNSSNENEISDNSSSCVNSNNEKENSDSSSSYVNSSNENEISVSSSSCVNSNDEKENSDSSSTYVNSSNEKEISDNSSSCVNSNSEKENSDNSSSYVNSNSEKEISDNSNSCVNSNNEKENSDNSSSCVKSNNMKEMSDNSSSCVNSNNEKENMGESSIYVNSKVHQENSDIIGSYVNRNTDNEHKNTSSSCLNSAIDNEVRDKKSFCVNSTSDTENSNYKSNSSKLGCVFCMGCEENMVAGQDCGSFVDISSSDEPSVNSNHRTSTIPRTTTCSVPLVLSNSIPALLDDITETKDNIFYESTAISSDRMNSATFVQDELLETNTICTFTRNDAGLDQERRPDDKTKKLENLQLSKYDKPNTILFESKTHFSNGLEIDIKKKQAALHIKSNGESIIKDTTVSLNDSTSKSLDMYEDAVWADTVSSISNLVRCKTNKMKECNQSQFIRVYEGNNLVPSDNCENPPALWEDCREGHDKCLVTDFADQFICSTFLDGKPDRNRSSQYNRAHAELSEDRTCQLGVTRLSKNKSNEVKSITFLSILTRKLLETANNEMLVTKSDDSTSAAERNVNSQTDTVSEKLLTSLNSSTSIEGALISDHEDTHSFRKENKLACQITSPRGSVSHSGANAESKHRTDVISKNQFDIHKSAVEKDRNHVCSEGSTQFSVLRMLQEKPRHHIRTDRMKTFSAETPSLKQQEVYSSNSTKFQKTTKDQMFLTDSVPRKSEKELLTPKERQTATLNVLQEASKALRDSDMNVKSDVSYKVDIFKTLNYASSLSFGCSTNSSYNGAICCGHDNLFEEQQSPNLILSLIDEMSHNDLDSEAPSDLGPHECHEDSKVCNSTEEKEVADKQEEAVDSYSRARLLRASQRRRKLMTEIEEITSCADAHNWARIDSRNSRYEQRSLCPVFDYTVNREVTDLESKIQSKDKNVIGTLTIEYLNPPINGLVILQQRDQAISLR